jgi:hypothetical protein
MRFDFKETQKFTQWWFWLFIVPIGFLPIIGIYKQLILGKPFGEHPMSDTGLIIFSIIIFSFISLFFFLELKTEINKYEITIKFSPFTNKRYKWNEIKSVELINYGFVGGWGIRLWTKYGTVYNVKGNKGLFIQLQNGKKLLIGTQKEEELRKVIQRIQESKPS